jgi:hypothetical protein
MKLREEWRAKGASPQQGCWLRAAAGCRSPGLRRLGAAACEADEPRGEAGGDHSCEQGCERPEEALFCGTTGCGIDPADDRGDTADEEGEGGDDAKARGEGCDGVGKIGRPSELGCDAEDHGGDV